MKTEKYTIVSDQSIPGLEKEVNSYLKEGYMLVGGISVHVNTSSGVYYYRFFQAVAKPIITNT
jgi:hypothetical protein